MDLPKNITQIGQANRNCKVYVEDYVVSYIKQINYLACNKNMAVAIYGTRKTENSITYIFVYGACKLDFLQRETRHLSQAQQQEIEKLRRKHFPEYEFQGYRLLNGEMVEGFHICEQDICRYIEGYAQFYEKNDNMLAYMLETRNEEASPERVEQEKYEVVKKRQEERREEYKGDFRGDYRKIEEEKRREQEKKTVPAYSGGVKRMRVSTAAVFGILCLAGLAMLWDEQGMVSSNEEVSTLIAQDKLSQAVLAENDALSQETAVEVNAETALVQTPEPTVMPTVEPAAVATSTPIPVATVAPTPVPVPTSTPAPTATPVPTAEPTAEPVEETLKASASYVIQKGDSLTAICIRQYGSDELLETVCELNGIENPDDIKVGEKILLP